jgi:hypothetical protein
MTDKEREEIIKRYREKRNLPPKEKSNPFDCMIEEKCMKKVVNVFFYSTVSIAVWLLMSNLFQWVSNLF